MIGVVCLCRAACTCTDLPVHTPRGPMSDPPILLLPPTPPPIPFFSLNTLQIPTAAAQGNAPLQKARFTWVTERGRQERWVVASCGNYTVRWNLRVVKIADASTTSSGGLTTVYQYQLIAKNEHIVDSTFVHDNYSRGTSVWTRARAFGSGKPWGLRWWGHPGRVQAQGVPLMDCLGGHVGPAPRPMVRRTSAQRTLPLRRPWRRLHGGGHGQPGVQRRRRV